ncbi:VRR-NUC domain-containing protein [Acidithiobacillus ferrivorans]|uniref:VRR-NUC domain-containing protein n=1 Tax=Acidithiobacillus ferrivorans TaxID=160808 RepID=A0A7T5BIT4_9PROT|nr:VRR-NUC domain-containing protein [Acidithiobacillus ferrivorans]QQD73623.1 VRR-NUC domain-containing protein [Acidithiobacillus ferrivorans]
MSDRTESPCTEAYIQEMHVRAITSSDPADMDENRSPLTMAAPPQRFSRGPVPPEILPGPYDQEKKDLCLLFCCCAKHPSVGTSDKGESINYYQHCVSDTLDRMDKESGGKGKYKPEVSYARDTGKPFLHRDPEGRDTTEKSHHWIQRAWKEIPGYRPGEGMVRRPDVSVPLDPDKPLSRANLKVLVEMKHKGDDVKKNQIKDYEKTAGDKSKVILLNEENCRCDEKQTTVDRVIAKTRREVKLLENSALVRAVKYTMTHRRLPPLISGSPAIGDGAEEIIEMLFPK